MTTGENIKALRESRKMTQKELAEQIGVTNATISEWERDKNGPRAGSLQRMSDVFGVPMRDIMDGARDPRELEALLGEFMNVAETELAYSVSTKAPYFGRIAAGEPIEMISAEGSLWVPPDLLAAHPKSFYLRVQGESMNLTYPSGSFVLIDPDSDIRSGDVAAVWVNGRDAVIKKVLLGYTSITLVPESDDAKFVDELFDQTRPDTATVDLIGKVIWYLPPYTEMVRF